MYWIAPSEKDPISGTLEKRLWDSADQFRANSGLKAQEYSGPILGIIFLRFAEARFAAQRAKLEKVYHGRVLDPACGSGGMFVQSAHFVAEHKKNPSAELSIHGVEKTDETVRLCRMDVAVHGLEGDIRHRGQVNSYYDDSAFHRDSNHFSA